MTAQTISQGIYVTTADTPAYTLLAGDTLIVVKGASVIATGTGASHGIVLGGANQVTVTGSIYSYHGNGIFSAVGSNSITISRDATVFGNRGIDCRSGGGNTITNHGTVDSVSDGITLFGPAPNIVTNTGVMRSAIGVPLNFVDTGTLNNSGIIESRSNYAIVAGSTVSIDNSGSIRGVVAVDLGVDGDLTNSGTIAGTNAATALAAVAGQAGVNVVVNTGSIESANGLAVRLFGGNDTYDGRGGRVIGAVRGDEGTDTLYGGGFVDRLEGGSENDQINGGGSGDYIDGGQGYDFARYDFATTGIQARLDNAALNTGEAAGDTMYNFEGLVGSQNGDILAGNDLAIGNQIHGLGGNDTIRGNGGADILYGNAGADSIFTGAGTDTVWVQAADLIATQLDRVFDFTDGQDHLRFQGISAASATITDSQGGTLIQFNVAGGQFSVFLDGITKAASADQIFFV